MTANLRIGLFGIGLDTYWGQFPGLLERLTGYLSAVSSKLQQYGAEVINAGMVDNPYKAAEAASLFNRAEADLIILNISTYALSHNVLPLLQRTSAPLLVLNLQPEKALDYVKFNSIGDRGTMTGEWLAYCQSCVTPELASVFNRAGIKYNLITGYLDEGHVWQEVSQWLDAMKVKKLLASSRVGVMGHYYNGMLDVYSDMTLLASSFGCHFELIEFGVLKEICGGISESEIIAESAKFEEWFNVSPECPADDIRSSAVSSVALRKLASVHDLGALAYYYEGAGDPSSEKIVASLIPGMTILTGQNIPVAGECEIKNVLAMKIMDAFGSGGSFSEFYLADFEKDEVLMGHDGPAHFRIAEGRVGLVPLPLFHGKPGSGLSIQMKVANGPVTLLSVCQEGDGKTILLVAEGESVEGPTLQIANTNSRYRFPVTARDFINNWAQAGPSHHCAIGIGHIAGKIEKLSQLLGLGYKRIC